MERKQDDVSAREGALMGVTPACLVLVAVVYVIVKVRNWQQRRSAARSPFDNPASINQPSTSASTQTTNPSNNPSNNPSSNSSNNQNDGHGNASDGKKDNDGGASDNIPQASTSMHASAASHLGNFNSDGAASSSHSSENVIDMTVFNSHVGQTFVNSFTNRSYTSPDKNESTSSFQHQGPPIPPKDPLAGLTPNLPKTDIRKKGVKSSKKTAKAPAIPPPVLMVSPTPKSSPTPTPNKARLSTLAPKPQPKQTNPVLDVEAIYENIDELLLNKTPLKPKKDVVESVFVPTKTAAMMDWDNSAHGKISFHGVSVLPAPNVNVTPSRSTRSSRSALEEHFELSRQNKARVASFVPVSIP